MVKKLHMVKLHVATTPLNGSPPLANGHQLHNPATSPNPNHALHPTHLNHAHHPNHAHTPKHNNKLPLTSHSMYTPIPPTTSCLAKQCHPVPRDLPSHHTPHHLQSQFTPHHLQSQFICKTRCRFVISPAL